MSYETWQLINSLECLLQYFVKLYNTKDNNKNNIYESFYCKVLFKVKYIWAKDSKQNKLHKALNILYSVWKTTLKTIYKQSCFVGHLVQCTMYMQSITFFFVTIQVQINKTRKPSETVDKSEIFLYKLNGVKSDNVKNTITSWNL